LPDLFSAQVAKTPDAIAVIFGEEEVCYRELDARANQLARYLIAEKIGPEDIVAIALDRSIEMVVSLLGVLKSGAAYLPLDPEYPVERLAFMLRDSDARRLITTSEIYARITGDGGARDSSLSPNAQVASYTGSDAETALADALLLDDEVLQAELATLSPSPISDRERIRPLTPDNLAYVIYTSGSTGRPKGASIHHTGLFNYIYWAQGFYRPEEGIGAPVNTSIAFDATVTSLWLPLVSGGCVYLLDQENEIEALYELLSSRQQLSLVKLTPAHVALLKDRLDPLKLAEQAHALVIGGEALRSDLLQPWFEYAPETRLINEYGPTESVVGCVVYQAKGSDRLDGDVPIGSPIWNTQIYVLDSSF
ncbi:MAG: AMP-binding protein, partial [Methylocystis sp.]